MRRVFIIWTNLLFIRSIQTLLNQPDIELLGTTSDLDVAYEKISQLRPDSVLVEENPDGTLPTQAFEMLEEGLKDFRLIRLSLADNQLTVYFREQRTLTRIEELLALI